MDFPPESQPVLKFAPTNIHQMLCLLVSQEMWPVTFFLFASIVFTQLLPVAVFVPALFWPLRWLACGKPTLRTAIDLPAALLLVSSLLSITITAIPDITRVQVFRLLSGLFLFYTIVNWATTRRRLRIGVLGVILVGWVLALAAPFSVAWFSDKLAFFPNSIYQRFILLVTDTIHPNVMGASLAIVLPIVFGIMLFAWKVFPWYQLIWLFFALMTMASVIILTQSRGAWLGLLVAVTVVVLLRWRWGGMLLLAVMSVSLIIMFDIGFPMVVGFLSELQTLGGLDVRLEIWSRAVLLIKSFPITGVGMGLYGKVTDAIFPFSLVPSNRVPHAHNLLLQVAVDLGIPGLIAWLAIWIGIVSTASKVYRYGRLKHAPFFTGLGAGLLASQAAIIVHGMVDAAVWGMVRPAPLVWALWGLTVAAFLVTNGIDEKKAPQTRGLTKVGSAGMENDLSGNKT